MSGETEKSISAWTNDTVLIHLGKLVDERTSMLKALIDGHDRRYQERFVSVANQQAEKDVRDQQRFDAQQLALRDALLAQEKAVSAALLAAQEAVSKAEFAAEKRFDAVNEFRAQLADQAATLMPRAEMTVVVETQNEKIASLEKRANEATGHASGSNDFWAYLVGAGALFAAIAAIVIGLTK